MASLPYPHKTQEARAWLVQPVAHRGLHNQRAGVIENTPSAFQAAVEAGYAIETDLREAACGTPIAFHDERLERLTLGSGLLADYNAESLCSIAFRGAADRMPTLAALLDQVAGRVPLFLEVKSNFTGQTAFAERIAHALRGYDGPVALMSFDPWLMGVFRKIIPGIPRGLGVTRIAPRKLPQAGAMQRFAFTQLLFMTKAQPHFIACEHTALTVAGPWLARRVGRLPVLAWTVRSPEDAERAMRNADAIIFEGFMP